MDDYYEDPNLQPPEKKSKFRAWVVRLGLGAFTVAVLAHIIGIILAIFVFYKWVYPPEEKVDFLPGGGGGGGSNGDQVHKIQQKRMMSSNAAVTKRIASTSSTAAFSIPESDNQMMDPGLPMEASSAELGSGGGTGGGHGTGTGTGTGSGTGPGKGFGQGQLGIGALIPTIMKGRCTDSERLNMVRDAGGTPQIEEAVKKSLQWLKGRQNSDGSWGRDHEVAMTGLTLLCYLGHCEGTQSAEYGDTVSKGMTYLINVAMKNDGRMTGNLSENNWVYEHAIATYALSEALTFSRTLQFKFPELENTVEKAVGIIVKGQTKGGGWDYKYADTDRNDLSVAGWQLQALKAAKASNVKIDGYDKVIRTAMEFMTRTAYLGDGKFAYTGKNAKPAMSAVAALCLQQHEKGNGLEARGAVKLIMEGLGLRDGKKPSKDGDFAVIYSMQYGGPDIDIYASYYAAQVMRNAGGKEWDAMNSAIIADILPAQNPDGSFKMEGTTNKIVVGGGSRGAGNSREIYAQTLDTLILEVYYRFLPTSAGKARSSALDDLR
jgi:hypothetical protein